MSEGKKNRHTAEELKQWQALPLEVKVAMTGARIRAWINEYGESGVYIAFSGGKDSTVLSHLVDKFYPGNNIPRVFVNTGLEYPEIVQFVKEEPRAILVKPKMNFKQVIEKYGYPVISKEVSQRIEEARTALKNGKPNSRSMRILKGEPLTTKSGKQVFSCHRYEFMLDAPFKVSHLCCKVMKKSPSRDYAKETGRVAMTAEMASESRARASHWKTHGCNGFDLKFPKSTPMAFWTEQDVLEYIKQNNIKIASVYGEIVPEDEKSDVVYGQLKFADIGMGIEQTKVKLKTTGCSRTGCMFCGFGCQSEKRGEGRFLRMKQTHPKIYEWIMKPWNDGGLGYKEVIDWINENGGTHIEY